MCALQCFFDLLRTLQRRFFRFPDFLEIGKFTFEPADFRFQRFPTFFTRGVAFFLQRLVFNFELNQAAFESIHGFRLGINLHSYMACRLVD